MSIRCRRIRRPLTVMAACCALGPAVLLPIAQAVAQDTTQPRPRIGLVLGGGGAKGAAHVGVLRVLEDLRVPIDCVAGTSMGALVGGTFASGTPAAEVEREMLAIDWTRTVGGQGLRDSTPINRKLVEIAYSNPLEVGVGDGGVRTPSGLIRTQLIEDEIRRLVGRARLTQDFDELPLPFRAVATDMLAGEMVVLEDGDLATAMRASMAIPGAFAPVVSGDRVLADGGLVRNLPVDVARGLCADIVIAVWLEGVAPTAADLASALALVGRTFDVVIGANQRAQIATLTPADIGIAVAVGDIGASDFDRTPEAIALGRAAAETHRAALARYSVSEEEYRAWALRHGRADTTSYALADVRVVGLDRVHPGYVQAQLVETVPGQTVTGAALTDTVERVYALGDFERVEYRLLADGDGDTRSLEILPVEKSWGPDFLRFNLGLSTDREGDLLGILRADHTRTWVTPLGGVWHNTLQIGGPSRLSSAFYQPLDVRQRFFVQPVGGIENAREDLFVDGERVARYFVKQLFVQIDAGMNIGTRAQLRLGLKHDRHDAEIDTGLSFLPELDDERDTSLHVRAIYDTRDSVSLPTRGTFMSARYVHGDDWFDGELDYDIVEGVIAQSFNFRGNSLSVIGGGGHRLSGDPPVTEDIQLGGIRTFPGLRPGELRGPSYWYAGTTYFWRLFDLQPLFGQTLYAGLRLQAGEMHDRFDGIDEGTLYGLSGSVNGRTPIGPFVLSIGFVDNGSRLLQFTIGRPVPEGSILDELQ